MVTQRDPFGPEGYISQKTELPAHNLDVYVWKESGCAAGKSTSQPERAPTVPFPVKKLIQLVSEKGLLDGRRYLLMKNGEAKHIDDGYKRQETATGAW